MTGSSVSSRPACTGRHLVLLGAGTGRAAAALLHDAIGVRLVPAEDAACAAPAALAPGEGVLFDRLDAALLEADPDQLRALAALAHSRAMTVEPERVLRAAALRSPLPDGACASWGLEATGVLASRYSGRGVRVAILDTGLDLQHPDFARRAIRSKSFVAGLAVHDRNGHGTCCAGIACGPDRPRRGARYGIAYGAEPYVAKVLDDDANGTDGNVIAGIDWAVRKGCSVISISLGTPVSEGGGYSRVYERIASRALASGAVLIAPAGNSSQRPDCISPVEHPANCPSVLAVGAVNQSLAPASFSNGRLDAGNHVVDVMAPGTAMRSCAPRPALYQVASGTSTAAPFVAGIAALLAEASPDARGAALRALILKCARRLPGLSRAAGVGVVRAP